MQLKIRRLTILSLACFLLCLAPGCLIIPQGHKNIELEGKRIEQDKLSFVVHGKTTKAEVIEKLGQPYLVMDDWGVMAYYWKTPTTYLVLPLLWGQGGVADAEREHILFVSYDDNGCINKHEIISGYNFLGRTVNEQAITWAGKGESLKKSVPMSIPEGSSVVYVLLLENQYLASDIISGVILDGKLWAELKSKRYAAMVLPPGTHQIGVEPRIRKSEYFLDPQRKVQPEPWVVTTIDALPNKAYFLEITFYLDAIGLKPYFARPSQDEMLPKLAKAKRVR